jgi:ribosomal protein L37AE/L43A
MSNKYWRCVWVNDNNIWGSQNICYYCGQPADSIDHVIPQAMLRQLVCLEDGEITKAILRKRALKVWACRECNSLLSSSYQDSLVERKQFLKEKLKKKYKRIIALPKWDEDDLNEMGYVLRQYIENAARLKEFIVQRIAW